MSAEQAARELLRRIDIDADAMTAGDLVELANLIAANSQLAGAIDELLLMGSHPGPCTNEHVPEDCCELHIATSEARRERARETLHRWRPR